MAEPLSFFDTTLDNPKEDYPSALLGKNPQENAFASPQVNPMMAQTQILGQPQAAQAPAPVAQPPSAPYKYGDPAPYPVNEEQQDFFGLNAGAVPLTNPDGSYRSAMPTKTKEDASWWSQNVAGPASEAWNESTAGQAANRYVADNFGQEVFSKADGDTTIRNKYFGILGDEVPYSEATPAAKSSAMTAYLAGGYGLAGDVSRESSPAGDVSRGSSPVDTKPPSPQASLFATPQDLQLVSPGIGQIEGGVNPFKAATQTYFDPSSEIAQGYNPMTKPYALGGNGSPTPTPTTTLNIDGGSATVPSNLAGQTFGPTIANMQPKTTADLIGFKPKYEGQNLSDFMNYNNNKETPTEQFLDPQGRLRRRYVKTGALTEQYAGYEREAKAREARMEQNFGKPRGPDSRDQSPESKEGLTMGDYRNILREQGVTGSTQVAMAKQMMAKANQAGADTRTDDQKELDRLEIERRKQGVDPMGQENRRLQNEYLQAQIYGIQQSDPTAYDKAARDVQQYIDGGGQGDFNDLVAIKLGLRTPDDKYDKFLDSQSSLTPELEAEKAALEAKLAAATQ